MPSLLLPLRCSSRSLVRRRLVTRTVLIHLLLPLLLMVNGLAGPVILKADFEDVPEGDTNALQAAFRKSLVIFGEPVVTRLKAPDQPDNKVLETRRFGDGIRIPLARKGFQPRDFELRARVKVKEFGWTHANGPLLGLMYAPDDNYVIGVRHERYAEPQALMIQSLDAVLATHYEFAEADPPPVPVGEWVTLAIRVRGNEWVFTADGKKVFSGKMPEHYDAVLKGQEQLWVHLGTATGYFDDVEIENRPRP